MSFYKSEPASKEHALDKREKKDVKLSENYLDDTFNIHASTIEEAIEDIEKARLTLYYMLEEYKRISTKPLKNIYDFMGKYTASFDNGIIKIIINEYPSTNYIKDLETIIKIKGYWENITLCAVNDLLKERKIYYEKAFVYMKFYLPLKNCDTDNRNYKPIIDGIRYSLIVKEDTYEHICYMVDSQYSKHNPHTEIIICDYDIRKDIV